MFENVGIPESHSLKVLGYPSVVPCDADALEDLVALEPTRLRHPSVGPAPAIARHEVLANVDRIRQIQVKPTTGRNQAREFREKGEVVRGPIEVAETREEARHQSTGTRRKGNAAQVALEHWSAHPGGGEQVGRQVAPDRGDPAVAQGREVPAVAATRVEDDATGLPQASQERADLAPGLVEAAVPVQPLVFRSEPGLEPVPGRRGQDRLAARPSVETTSRASAAEKPVGSHASA